jgi:hypothetical protein
MSLELEWAVDYFSLPRHYANTVRCRLFLRGLSYLDYLNRFARLSLAYRQQ